MLNEVDLRDAFHLQCVSDQSPRYLYHRMRLNQKVQISRNSYRELREPQEVLVYGVDTPGLSQCQQPGQ